MNSTEQIPHDWYCNTCAHVFGTQIEPMHCPYCGAEDIVPDEDEV